MPSGREMIEDGLRLDALARRLRPQHGEQADKVIRAANRRINAGIRRLAQRPKRKRGARRIPMP